jgi:hypothetical protein
MSALKGFLYANSFYTVEEFLNYGWILSLVCLVFCGSSYTWCSCGMCVCFVVSMSVHVSLYYVLVHISYALLF